MDYAIEEENAIAAKIEQWKIFKKDGRTIVDVNKANKPREMECKQIESAKQIDWKEVRYDEKQRKTYMSWMKNRRKEKDIKHIRRIPVKIKWKSPEKRKD